MTKRNPDIQGHPMTVSFVADTDTIEKFKEIVGDQNFSKELRAMIKDRVEIQKNEQACLVDPLNLSKGLEKESRVFHTRQSTLFEDLAGTISKDDINKSIHKIQDPKLLGEIAAKGKCIWKVAEQQQFNLTHSYVRRKN